MERVINIEHASFIPHVFLALGGVSKKAGSVMKLLAQKESQGTRTYTEVISSMRKRIAITLVKANSWSFQCNNKFVNNAAHC
ncbi:hypothetical protein GJ496_009641 [Pomphorhynchus laevis]|nr:hypothetical protein GJ496_009641 [Pomphorhynchus laevis]